MAAGAVPGWCTFGLDGRLCGFDVSRVREVMRPQPVTRLPHAPRAVSGLINLRGAIVPAVDLRAVLGLAPAPPGTPGGQLIVFDGDSPVSLVVDTIGDVRREGVDALVPVPHTLEGPARELVAGAVPLADGLLLVLDLDRVLEHAFGGSSALTANGRVPRPAGGTP